MKNLLLSVVLLCVAAGTLQAQVVRQWTGMGSTDWTNPNNWDGPPPGEIWLDYIPGPYDRVKINNLLWGGYMPVIGGANGTQYITIGDVFMVDAGGLSPASLTVAAGGNFSVIGAGGSAQGQINIAYAFDGTASLIIDGGTATVAGPVHVGWGGTGSVVINSGSLSVLAIDIGGAGGTGSIVVNGGQLVVQGFVVPQLTIYQGNGQLTGVIAYDELTDTTIVTPEPISIALLGLGAVFLRKQK